MRQHSGFTLLEILVVLAIAALIAGVALPNLQRIRERVAFAAERADLIAQIDQLPYRSFVTGSAIDLTAESAGQPTRDGQPALILPEGWRLSIPRPIHYGLEGLCSGGVVILSAPDAPSETFTLTAPRCHPSS